MRTDPFYIAQIIRGKFKNELTEEEARVLQEWSAQDPRNFQLLHILEEDMKRGIDTHIIKSFDEDQAWSRIQKKRRKRSLLRWGRVAAVLAAVSAISFFFLRSKEELGTLSLMKTKDQPYKEDVLPAIKGAKIILADGVEVKVDDNIVLLEDGTVLTEKKKTLLEGGTMALNKLIVPTANFLNLTLSDGTKVWINANSELVFPSRFAKGQRKVKLKGEAYFQVFKDVKRPFTVETLGGNVKVLGTSFNVSAYDDAPTTTLEEGKVLVYRDDLEQTLLPGTRAKVMESRIDVRQADLLKELAWKNNLFYFKGDNIVTIAKQLQNWYGIDVSFSRGVSLLQTYTGEIKRDSNLSEVLKMLEFVSGLVFKIENNKLLISKKQEGMI